MNAVSVAVFAVTQNGALAAALVHLSYMAPSFIGSGLQLLA